MRVFSGIQPTNELHIGNYLGAIKQWIELQQKHECIFCVVDLHALTVPYDTSLLKQKTESVAGVYLAAGVNPEKSVIFVQSSIKEHTELCWILSTIAPLGDLQRMTQFKDKSRKHEKNINIGLLSYPILMVADILLYQTDMVPVGEDQKQHVELARVIAKKFNNKFGETFRVPKAVIPKDGARIMSLTEPNKKMSKSDPENTYISLFDSPKDIKKKISSATTDSGKEIKYDKTKKPGVSNLLTIYSLFDNKPISALEKQFKNKGYKEFKEGLANVLTEKLVPFRDLEAKPDHLEQVLQQGAKKAQAIATQTMQKVKRATGLI